MTNRIFTENNTKDSEEESTQNGVEIFYTFWQYALNDDDSIKHLITDCCKKECITGLSDIIDEPEEFIPDDFEGDLILNFLRHPDLSEYLVKICKTKGMPVIASGQNIPGAICPFTCCGLGRKKSLGTYGEQFGLPEYDVEVKDRRITELHVRRGASCGATWQVIPRMIEVPVDEALSTIGREIQYLCKADGSAFDPVSGKSPLHFAGKVHMMALKKALS